MTKTIPGHSFSLQCSIVEVRLSWQDPPKFSVIDLARVIFFVPSPHVTEHSEASFQSVHSQLMPEVKEKDMIVSRLKDRCLFVFGNY